MSKPTVATRSRTAWAVRGLLTPMLLLGLLTGCGTTTNPAAQGTATTVPTEPSGSATATSYSTLTLDGPALQFGIVVDTNLQVVDVEKGGAAETAGVQKGDILTTLENTPLTSTPQAKQLARELMDRNPATGQPVTLIVNRKGQAVTLHILPAPPAGRGGSPNQPVPTVTPVFSPYDYF